MGRPKDWRRVAQYVYVGDGRLWIRVTVTLPGGRSTEWGPRQCPVEWGTGNVGIAKATVRASEIAEQMRDGSLVRAVPVSETVEQFAVRFRETLKVRESTQDSWWGCARVWMPAIGHIPVASLTAADLQKWQASVANLKWSPLYRRNVVVTLRQLLRAAYREGIHRSDLSLRVESPPAMAQKRVDNLRWEQVTPALMKMPRNFRWYFFALGLLGLRGGELRSATLDDLQDGAFRVSEDRSKTRVARSIPLPEEVRPLLAELIASHRDPDGRRASDWWHKAGLPHSPHAMRRLCVSELGALGVRQALISAIVGHSARTMTEYYDGPRGRQELEETMELYWRSRVRAVYQAIGGNDEDEM